MRLHANRMLRYARYAWCCRLLLTLNSTLQVLLGLLARADSPPSVGSCEALQATAMFQCYFESEPHNEVDLCTDDAVLWKRLQLGVVDDSCRHSRFSAGVRCLQAAVIAVPNSTHGLSPFLPSLYAACAASDFNTSAEGDTGQAVRDSGLPFLLKLMTVIPNSALERLLQFVVTSLEGCIATLTNLSKQVSKNEQQTVLSAKGCTRATLTAVEEALSEFTRCVAQPNDGGAAAVSAASSAAEEGNSTHDGRGKRRKMLHRVAVAAEAARAEAPLAKAKTAAISAIGRVFQENLTPPSSSTGSLAGRALCFDGTVARMLDGRPRVQIHRALSAPQTYLRTNDAAHAADEPTDPDEAILYRLVLECGKWVNLHDMLAAFAAQVGHHPHAHSLSESTHTQIPRCRTDRARMSRWSRKMAH